MSGQPAFHVGQFYERGAWIPTERHAPHAALDIAKHFAEVQKKRKLKFSKLKAEVLKGDDPRTPKPQLQPYFVNVWAKVESKIDEETIDVSWVHELRPEDLERLRAATRKAAERAGKKLLPSEVDLYIGMKGPELARKMLEQEVSKQVVDGHVLKAAEKRKVF